MLCHYCQFVLKVNPKLKGYINMNPIKNILKKSLLLFKSYGTNLFYILLLLTFFYFAFYKYFYKNNLFGVGTEDMPYVTDFSGAKLINTNLLFTNFKAAKNLTIEQLKEAKNWDKAIYDDKLFQEH